MTSEPESGRTIRVVLVDDHEIVRQGLRFLLDHEEAMEVVGEAADGRAAVDLVRRLSPDVVLMDVSMPALDGPGATAQITSESPDTKVLALSAHDDRRFVENIFRAGASGYLLKVDSGDEVVRAIHAVFEGHSYVCPRVASTVVGSYRDKPDGQVGDSLLARLTDKERELLQLLSEGKSSKEAARLLHVSVKTIDARRRSISSKTGIDTIAGLTKLALREGLTTLSF